MGHRWGHWQDPDSAWCCSTKLSPVKSVELGCVPWSFVRLGVPWRLVVFRPNKVEPSTSHSMSHSTLLGFMERKVEPLTTPPVGSPGRNVSSGRPVDASGLVVGTTQKMVIRLRGTIQ